ncbi:NucA/NucB deoxyribonuclease domain-containing protein [Streptomyces sp. NPDC048279]|uniref:NucA/NucB deoxyribonuclease domain-containing protein n=1 Tax=Streptomyces sp. NPDC048279 TaxID=3154714 RepID=UPI00341BE01A
MIIALTLIAIPSQAAPSKSASANSIKPVPDQRIAMKGGDLARNSCTDIDAIFKKIKAKNGEKKATCLRRLSAAKAKARVKGSEAELKSGKSAGVALSGEGPDNTIPISCEFVYETWVSQRTWTCGGEAYVSEVMLESEDGSKKLIGELKFDVVQYVYAETSSPDLYDGLGRGAGQPNNGAPLDTWNYRVEVRKLPTSWGDVAGSTVTVVPHWCEIDDLIVDETGETPCDGIDTTDPRWHLFGVTPGNVDVTGHSFDADPIAVGKWKTSTAAINLGDDAWSRPSSYVEITVPGTVNRVTETYPSGPPLLRCDTVDASVPTGCVYQQFTPSMRYALDGEWADYPELAWHIKQAQQGYGVPGRNGGGRLPGSPSGSPLTRVDDAGESGNRGVACPGSLPRPADDSCDEYPFNSTAEGAKTGSYSCRMINETQNSGGGSKLGWFYRKQHVLPGDEFFVDIVGDDYTGSRTWSPNDPYTCSYPVTEAPQPSTARTGLDLTAANRRGAVAGVYDWSHAGYREGATGLPTASNFSTSGTCIITAAEFAANYQNMSNNGDASVGLQQAIDDIKANCSATAGFNNLSLIELPPGDVRISRQIYVDADYLVIRGSGFGPVTGTRIVFEPDVDTRYDTITSDGSNWDKDAMTSGPASGGWIWPGRGLFRVQSRAVHPDYQEAWDLADDNRKDLLEGTVNVHWKAGAKLRDKPNDTGFAARTGDTKIYIRNDTNSKIRANLVVGKYVNIRAANTMNFYRQMSALPTDSALQPLQMRQQIFKITGVGTSSSDRWITIDKPLEYDVPVTSESDGSEPIPCDEDANGTDTCPTAPVDSKASPLVDPVEGVGFENLYITQVLPGQSSTTAVHNYGNMDPAAEMNGIVFKWAVNDWVKNVNMSMTGSHPIVTEEAKNLTITDNYLDGAWNKGKGGNGYFRGSRVWDSVYAGNTTRNLRHFTFQWSASGNVAIGNDFDSDLNLHGGWERNKLFELNTSTVPYEHRSGSCYSNCGDEGGNAPDDSTWFPIWWAAGQKAVKWCGSSGPNNVFFNNTMKKQLSYGSGYTDYYADHNRIYRFGWGASGWTHLTSGGGPISDWSHHELLDYTGSGVDSSATSQNDSLFLLNVT